MLRLPGLLKTEELLKVLPPLLQLALLVALLRFPEAPPGETLELLELGVHAGLLVAGEAVTVVQFAFGGGGQGRVGLVGGREQGLGLF